MADFFRTSTVWVIDYRFEGRARRWFKAFGPQVDVATHAAALLHGLYGKRARLVDARPASAAEELQYLRGETPKNTYCPTGRTPGPDREPGPR